MSVTLTWMSTTGLAARPGNEVALQAGDVEALAGLMQRAWAAAGPAPVIPGQIEEIYVNASHISGGAGSAA